jgi:hypothetical protein
MLDAKLEYKDIFCDVDLFSKKVSSGHPWVGGELQ